MCLVYLVCLVALHNAGEKSIGCKKRILNWFAPGHRGRVGFVQEAESACNGGLIQIWWHFVLYILLKKEEFVLRSALRSRGRVGRESIVGQNCAGCRICILHAMMLVTRHIPGKKEGKRSKGSPSLKTVGSIWALPK